MRSAGIGLSCTVTLLVALNGAPSAQTASAPVFRSSVNLVTVNVSVTDRRGSPVTDLTIDDFAITEGGKSQVIAAFSRVELAFPSTAHQNPAVDTGTFSIPDVQSNEVPEGRV